MRWYKPALVCTAALATFGLTALAPLSAKALSVSTYSSVWMDGPTVGTGSAGECLGVLGGNMTNGTPIVTWTCNGHPDQTWEIQVVNGSPGGPIWTQIVDSQDPSKCLGVLSSATTDGSQLVIWDCNGNADQYWTFVPWPVDNRNGPFGCYNIVNFNADPKVLGVLGGTPSDGAQTVIWDLETTHLDQVWCPFQPS